jgi:branched-chain amino acid transport system ATP-binding protein
LLELREIHTYYGKIPVLRNVSCVINQGEVIGVIGANGAGKTTLIKTISGSVVPRLGKIDFLGTNIAGFAPAVIVKLGISQVPEGRRLFPLMTVAENLELGAYYRVDTKEIAKDFELVFSLFPTLKARRKQLAGTLSGGEQQMVAIGRGLMSRPRLLLLDEPSFGLSPIMVDALYDVIKKINDQGITILLIEQNANMAFSITTRTYVLETGRIVLNGFSKDLLNNEMVKRSFLGK